MPPMTELSQTLSVLSAMITPVVLIMASSSLILSTSQRLSRTIERTRKLADKMENLMSSETSAEPSTDLSALFSQLRYSSQRARYLQKAMASLYLTLFIFIASCISIAMVYFFIAQYAWIPVALDILGICFLFYASLILMAESRLAITAVNKEMDYTVYLFKKNFPEVAKPDSKWWKRILSLQRRQ